MSRYLVCQLLLQLLLSASCLAVCSSNVTSEPTIKNGRCARSAQAYDLCKGGRGFCYSKGTNVKRLKCFNGLPCGCFPDVLNGYFVLTDPKDNVLGATAELTCYPGYRVDNTTTITCKVNSTWSLPSRKCNAVDCGASPLVQNGAYTAPFGTTYPAVGHIVCAEGYVLTHSSHGDAFLRCDKHGDWNLGSATCEPIDCGDPPTLAHGVFNASSGTIYQSEAELDCDDNYFPDNDSLTSIVCDARGGWSSQYATCVTPACGAFPANANGEYHLTDPSNSEFGATAELTCSPGYYASGPTTIDCTVSGNWDSPSGTCEPKDCGVPPPVQHGYYDTPSGTTYPEVGYMMCDAGFVLTYSSGDSLLRCDENGDWNSGSTTCLPVDCDSVPSIANGFFTLTGPSTLGATAKLTCSPGYYVSGPTTVNCTASGEWSSPHDVCEIEDCGPAPPVQNGAYTTPLGTTYHAVGHMWCEEGFVLTYSSHGDAFIRCDVHGDWINGSATCQAVDCDNPPILQHGVFNASNGTDYPSEAFLVCDNGARPGNENQTRIVCEANGDWTTTHTTCFTPGCYLAGASWHYSENWGWTKSDKTCQRWDQQTPHTHEYWRNWTGYPGETYTTAENYCRDPTGEGYPPWCVTMDPAREWEYCGIPVCKAG